ncbi:MAG: molybdopterin-dependent oxidoreductase [Haloarculaceae archaeon]
MAFSIQSLGHLGDLLAFVFSVVLTVAILAASAWVGLSVGRWSGIRFAAAIGAYLLVWIVTALLTGLPTVALAATLPALVVVALLVPGSEPLQQPPGSTVRRRAIAAVGGALGFGVIAYLVGRTRTMPPREPMEAPPEATRLAEQARARQFDVESIPGLVSPTDEFYEVDINSINPMVDADRWELTLTGAVDTEFALTYDELRAMPAETKFKTLRCVGEQLNAKLMNNAIWTGVPITRLLDRASPQSGCECVLLRAADGYFEEFPLAALERGFLAYGMNGESLPRGHGYPVRALIPGHWGEINVKWLTEVEVLERETNGYWENRGWHGTGPVNTVAKIWTNERLDDGSVLVGGLAYAGTRGIERVEISTDGGTTWTDAAVSGPLDEADVLGGRDAWRQWQYTWTPSPGQHVVVARAVDGEGRQQPRDQRSPFPNGASGWVSITISV